MMRTDEEMYEIILGVARADERIRGVYLSGSRASPNAPKDIDDELMPKTRRAQGIHTQDYSEARGMNRENPEERKHS